MMSSEGKKAKRWKTRLKLAVAGLALAGALAGTAAVATDTNPVSNDETAETSPGWWRYARGVSWQ